ncbi:MAG: hypothetical protein KME57_09705 [Scytonema hyalinum WJT4-NPBG1]|jgi:hypothetical protein|nr:hypothetical protein [Scytonema hyalinum WJT4-NPBG1]
MIFIENIISLGNDTPANLEIILNSLTDTDFEVATAINGEAAMNVLTNTIDTVNKATYQRI